MPATSPISAVVFTDLDGTLLDHHTYSWEAARPALDELIRRRLPLVLCSSKTRAEMVLLQRELGTEGLLIVENGGGIFSSGGGPLNFLFDEVADGLPARVFGVSYIELRAGLLELRGMFGPGVRGFGDTDPAGVAEWTGLPLAQAELAWHREFDEPFLWEPEPSMKDVTLAAERLTARGLKLTRGGRFWHLIGGNDKGRAVNWLLERWASRAGHRPRSLALGDSENDLPMLTAVDSGVLVERYAGGHLSPRPPQVGIVAGRGPEGWNRAVLMWLRGLPAQVHST
jgi:mannosyl-3-phosphoglycerate phosphatase